MRNRLVSYVAVIGLMAIGLAANAQDTYLINYSFVTSGTPSLNIYDSGYLGDAYAGPFTAVFNSDPGHGNPPTNTNPPPGYTLGNPFSVYCVDITHNIFTPTTEIVTLSQVGNGNNTTVTQDPFVSVGQLQEAAWLIDTYGGTLNQEQLAGLQVAVWDVVAGNPIALSQQIGQGIAGYSDPGSFSVSQDGLTGYSVYSDVVGYADADLNALGAALATHTNGGGPGTLFQISPPTHTTGQNMMAGTGFTGGGGFQPTTPEGSTVAMFALGMAPLFGTFWFKRRDKTAKHPVA